MRELPPGRL
jgi:hypothetical protein